MDCIIDLSSYQDGEIKDISVSVTPEDDILGTSKVIGEVSFDGWIVKSDNTLSFSGNAEYTVGHICDLCGEPFDRKYSTKVSATYSEKPEEGEFAFDGVSVDVWPPIRECIILAMPSRLVCKSGCKGLCPHCGKNLNTGKCDCSKKEESANNPFASLKNINFTGGASNGSTKE